MMMGLSKFPALLKFNKIFPKYYKETRVKGVCTERAALTQTLDVDHIHESTLL